MLKSLSVILLLSVSLGACVTKPVPEPDESESVAESIAALEESMALRFTESCDQNIEDLGKRIDKLRRAKQTTRIIERCSNETTQKRPNEKLLLGSIERVVLVKEELKFDARIDTGADTSSIGVAYSRPFERDGKKWVRFALDKGENAKVYEYPVHDTVKIKQTSNVTEDRTEIKIDIEMGGKKYKKQIFNLADRSHLDYQLLIGRSFLRDIAIVDVSRKKLLKGS